MDAWAMPAAAGRLLYYATQPVCDDTAHYTRLRDAGVVGRRLLEELGALVLDVRVPPHRLHTLHAHHLRHIDVCIYTFKIVHKIIL